MSVNAQNMLERYLEAEQAILDARSTTFNGRTLTMADLPDIQKGRAYWERRVEAQRPGGGGPGYVRFL